MATVEQRLPGVWLVTCLTCGYIGATIHMARDRADQLATDHNRTHLTEEKES